MNKPSKEEVEESIRVYKRDVVYGYGRTPAETRALSLAVSLLTAYRDGELVEKNQWISVKDRLPEYGDEYNVVWEFEFSNPVVTTMLFGFLKKSKIK